MAHSSKILNSIYWQNNIVGTLTLQKYYLIESITMCSTKKFLDIICGNFFLSEKKR